MCFTYPHSQQNLRCAIDEVWSQCMHSVVKVFLYTVFHIPKPWPMPLLGVQLVRLIYVRTFWLPRIISEKHWQENKTSQRSAISIHLSILCNKIYDNPCYTYIWQTQIFKHFHFHQYNVIVILWIIRYIQQR